MINQLQREANTRLNGNWEEVFSELTKGDNLKESMLLERIIAANSQAAQAQYFQETGKNVDMPTSALPTSALPTLLNSGVATHVFWWGFNIEISHSALNSFINSADPINTAIDTIGGSTTGAAAPWIKLIALFIAGALKLLKTLDKGRGIYISMSWFAPGIFIPTSV
ncbi:MAG: hypothetical protein V7L20_31690 [Nostoc sp.]|uniref:hypothetical protein n=1 Tax=Nostoc sp. TaxID=1180 RepID=UPI002FFC4487